MKKEIIYTDWRKPFSSALINAIDLVKETSAITLRERSGGNINHIW